ncbi:hypothetical protein BGW36DRAFT_423980 [Talaromyces proteolyticus]|uniref:Uncharacterized protein n=1 Tax=Talaromyces proteolyticus TaxID=1131652 RepID=A0AAD4Q3E2_9EURO|nr:uncharacterized protein BGW36DRAFT_423980 [Talaromyces proteolyticus]KAH8701678.1 hypothetical protein BGW36DRAFT_423980 [Talaromyces proteolyticus]
MATVDDSPHSSQHHHHRVSPSFTDSAIDVKEELSECTSTSHDNDPASPLPDRISRIAQLAAAQDPSRQLNVDERAAVDRHLEGLERLLLLSSASSDPRPQISHEIAKIRPVRRTSISPTGTITPPIRRRNDNESHEDGNVPAPRTIQQTSCDLSMLLEEISIANSELQQRRIESRHIHDLFTIKCEGMAQRIIELENEIHELRSDILEDTINLEGLRGTVRGLESWIGRWQRQREVSIPPPSTSSTQRGSKWKRKGKQQQLNRNAHDIDDGDDDNDFDTLLDGISAWMRGWNDVEDGFRIRARRRKIRRERQIQSITSQR